MKLYNTLTKRKEEFKPRKNKSVTIYNCGPTVYNSPTLGNLRTYINVDLLRRSLKFLGYKVTEVMNITDVEDKIIRDSAKAGVDYKMYTKPFEVEFLSNLSDLNIETAEKMPHATAEIPTMIKIIEKLLKTGHAYKSEDGSIYFSVIKFKNYGKLSGLENRELKSGARVLQDEYDKENAQDFALWKAAKEGEPSWKGPEGIMGRPGWHIECTAMSLKYLGEQIDIHTGAVDLIFPHHENEIAQSEAYTGKTPFVKYWFHPEHLLVNGQRMGKSLGNFYILSDLKKKLNVEPLAYRLLCLTSHYRDRLNFTEESIFAASITLTKLRRDIAKLRFFKAKTVTVKADLDKFKSLLSDDLNVPQALALLFSILNGPLEQDSAHKLGFALEADKVFGLGLNRILYKNPPAEIEKIVQEREIARKAGDYKKSDELRNILSDKCYSIDDTKIGPFVYKSK